MSRAEEDASTLVDLGRSVVERAIAGGANVAEAGVHSGSHLSVKVRMGEPELVEEAGSRALGLRVMVGQRVASTDLTAGTAQTVTRAPAISATDVLSVVRPMLPSPWSRMSPRKA